MKKILFIAIAMSSLFGCFKMLQHEDNIELNRAIERCNGKDNIVEHYTNLGDIYYSCKIAK